MIDPLGSDVGEPLPSNYLVGMRTWLQLFCGNEAFLFLFLVDIGLLRSVMSVALFLPQLNTYGEFGGIPTYVSGRKNVSRCGEVSHTYWDQRPNGPELRGAGCAAGWMTGLSKGFGVKAT